MNVCTWMLDGIKYKKIYSERFICSFIYDITASMFEMCNILGYYSYKRNFVSYIEI